MKHFLHCFFIFLPILSIAQSNLPIDKKSGNVVYTGVIDARGVSFSELQDRMQPFYDNFLAEGLTPEYGGGVSGKTFTDVVVSDGTSTERQRLWYSLNIKIANGKLAYELKDFSLQRHCIPAREIPCEQQSSQTPIEALLKHAGKGKKKKTDSNPYSIENSLDNAITKLVTAMKNSASTENRIATTGKN